MNRAIKITAIVLTVVVILTAALTIYLLTAYRASREYGGEINRRATEYGIEEELIYAVIKTESGFDPLAVSAAGAVGLMQIMPETGEWIAGKLNKPAYTAEMLFDPACNIEFGAWYLAYLLGKFDFDNTLAAYNAGEGNVKKWLADGIATPYKETRDYVGRVKTHYKFYKKFM